MIQIRISKGGQWKNIEESQDRETLCIPIFNNDGEFANSCYGANAINATTETGEMINISVGETTYVEVGAAVIEIRSRIKTREGNYLCSSFGEYGTYSFLWCSKDMKFLKPATVQEWVWATTEWGTAEKAVSIQRGEWVVLVPFCGGWTASFEEHTNELMERDFSLIIDHIDRIKREKELKALVRKIKKLTGGVFLSIYEAKEASCDSGRDRYSGFSMSERTSKHEGWHILRTWDSSYYRGNNSRSSEKWMLFNGSQMVQEIASVSETDREVRHSSRFSIEEILKEYHRY